MSKNVTDVHSLYGIRRYYYSGDSIFDTEFSGSPAVRNPIGNKIFYRYTIFTARFAQRAAALKIGKGEKTR